MRGQPGALASCARTAKLVVLITGLGLRSIPSSRAITLNWFTSPADQRRRATVPRLPPSSGRSVLTPRYGASGSTPSMM
jgi:hypothetical protein